MRQEHPHGISSSAADTEALLASPLEDKAPRERPQAGFALLARAAQVVVLAVLSVFVLWYPGGVGVRVGDAVWQCPYNTAVPPSADIWADPAAESWTCARLEEGGPGGCESAHSVGRMEFRRAQGSTTCGGCACCTRAAVGTGTRPEASAAGRNAALWRSANGGWYCQGRVPGRSDAWCEDPGDAGSKYHVSRGDGTCGNCTCCAKLAAPDIAVEAAAQTAEGSASLGAREWYCHEYVSGQNDTWCSAEPLEGGLEFKFAMGDGTCGSCMCCARPASKMAIVTAETRISDPLITMLGVPGRYLRNVGLGRQWKGFFTKVQSYLSFLKQYAQLHPKRIVVMSDTDMLYGGCSDQELLDRYRRVSEASDGAPIVVGADPVIHPDLPPEETKRMQELTWPRRAAVLHAFNLSQDLWPYFTPPYAHGTYSYPNSGFIMGPAAFLRDFMVCALQAGWDKGTFDDQRGVMRCMLQQPHKVTVDYTGTLVLTSHQFPGYLFSLVDGKVVNNLANETQCFVHANGGGCRVFQPFNWLAWMARVTKHFRPVRQPNAGTVALLAGADAASGTLCRLGLSRCSAGAVGAHEFLENETPDADVARPT